MKTSMLISAVVLLMMVLTCSAALAQIDISAVGAVGTVHVLATDVAGAGNNYSTTTWPWGFGELLTVTNPGSPTGWTVTVQRTDAILPLSVDLQVARMDNGTDGLGPNFTGPGAGTWVTVPFGSSATLYGYSIQAPVHAVTINYRLDQVSVEKMYATPGALPTGLLWTVSDNP